MFWRVSGFAQPSPVEAALDRPNCTLENLLAEDDLIQVGVYVCLDHLVQLAEPLHRSAVANEGRGGMQEVKSLNSRVLEFLTKPESVTGLVRHLVAPAPPDADQQQQLRQPFAACEVSCGVCTHLSEMKSSGVSSLARQSVCMLMCGHGSTLLYS